MEATVSPQDLIQLQSSAAEASKLLKALANEDRLMLLCQISRDEKCVSDLEQMTGIRQPTLSQQLTVLREQGFVSTRRAGKQIFYTLTSNEAMEIIHVLFKLFCEQPRPD